MLTVADVNQMIIKKIVKHSCAVTLTEEAYILFDIKKFVDAINKELTKKEHSSVSLLKNVLYISIYLLYLM